MREDTLRRRLHAPEDVGEIIANCFKQVGVLSLNEIDLTDSKARHWVYQNVQAKEVNVLTINLTAYQEIMEMWLRSQGSNREQIHKHNKTELATIIKWINQLLKIQDRQDLHYVVEADKKTMAMSGHEYVFRGSTEEGRPV